MNYIEQFKKSAGINTDKKALVSSDTGAGLTYGELDGLSGRVAGKLKALNVSGFVAVIMGRCVEYAAYLGVLKAGCAVVPVIPDYPQERIDFIVNNCEASLIITEDFFNDINSFEPFENPADEKESALLLYTSGLTGTLKGILYSVADIARAAERTKILFGGIDSLNYAAMCPLSFIAHITEYLTVFLLGGCTHILSDEIRHSAAMMKKYYERERIAAG